MSLLLVMSFTISAAPMPADAAGVKAKTYANCTEINKKYKGGATKYKPFVSKALYEANKKSDRDKDLIACER